MDIATILSKFSEGTKLYSPIFGIVELYLSSDGLPYIFLGISFLVIAGYMKLNGISSKFSYIEGYNHAVTKTMLIFEELTKDTLTTKDKCKFEEFCFTEFDNDLQDSLTKLYEN